MAKHKIAKKSFLWSLLIIIFIFSVIPIKFPGPAGSDKVRHFISYFFLCLLFSWNGFSLFLSLLFSTSYGAFLESVQYFIPYRLFSPLDMLANSLGAGLFILLMISSKAIRFCKTTFFVALFIIISASFTRQLISLIINYTGGNGVNIFIWLIFGIAGLIFLIHLLKDRFSPSIIVINLSILLLGIFFIQKITIPAERIHFVEYGVLGWLAGKDLISKQKMLRGIILTCIFIAFIGILDEGFQAILPYRVFDLRDIGFNILGGVWGTVLYLLGQ